MYPSLLTAASSVAPSRHFWSRDAEALAVRVMFTSIPANVTPPAFHACVKVAGAEVVIVPLAKPRPVKPVTLPPVIATADAACVAIVPKPVTPAAGKPVQLVNVPLVGVPSSGVTSVGDVAHTRLPEPVRVLLDSVLNALE